MKIPNKLQIHGRIIKTKWRKKAGSFDNKNYLVGLAEYSPNIIRLCKSGASNSYTKLDKSNLEQIYLHEIVHFIFNETRHDDLNKDENFVNEVSCILHQIIKQLEN